MPDDKDLVQENFDSLDDEGPSSFISDVTDGFDDNGDARVF